MTPDLREQDIPTSPCTSLPPLKSSLTAVASTVAGQSSGQPSGERPIQVGDVLARRFALVEQVASGGIMTVYRARDLLADRYAPDHSTVAVKIVSPALRSNVELASAVLGTAARMRTLRHAHIEQVLELHQFAEDYGIVSEWLDGETLAQKFDRSGRLCIVELLPVLKGVVAALQHAHASGIVHGDLKPGNVFLCRDGRVKLLDFGFRLPAGSGDPVNGTTGLYASCEMLEGQVPTPQDDGYSLACLLYRVLTGEWAYGCRSALEAEVAAAEPGRPIGLSGPQWAALRKGLVFRRAGRLASVQELLAPFVYEPPRQRTHWVHRAVLALLLIAIVTAVASSIKIS